MNKQLLTLLSLISLCNNAYCMKDVVMADVKLNAETSLSGSGVEAKDSKPARKKLKAASGVPIAVTQLIEGEEDPWLEGTVSNETRALFIARKWKIRDQLARLKASETLKARKRALYDEVIHENAASAAAMDVDSRNGAADVKRASENDAETRALVSEFVEHFGSNTSSSSSSDSSDSDTMTDVDGSSSSSSSSDDDANQQDGTDRNKLGQILYTCRHPSCSYKGPIAEFRNHVASHKNERKFKCDKCPKKFNAKKHLNQHLKTHANKNKPFTCPQCDHGSETSKGLACHIARAHKAKSVKCSHPGCDSIVETSALHLHMKIHSANQQSKETFSHNKGAFKCDFCADTFENNNTKIIHINRLHNVQTVECPLCKKNITKTGLTMHMRYHK